MEADECSDEGSLDAVGWVDGRRTPSAMRLSSKSRPLFRSSRQHPERQLCKQKEERRDAHDSVGTQGKLPSYRLTFIFQRESR